MNVAAVYARVSTTNQKEHGSSLGSQVEACLRLAADKGHDVPPGLVFQEDWTGTTLDRPLLDEVRRLVREEKIAAVVAYSTDRVSRDPIDLAIVAQECERHQVELLLVTEPFDGSPEGELLRFVRGWASKLEHHRILDRTTRGKRSRAQKGMLPTGGMGLYGYDYISGKEEGQGVRAVNEEQARVVRMVFRWTLEDDLTLGRIAMRLTNMGIPSPKGCAKWGISSVRRMLHNPAYTGETYAFRMQSVEPLNPSLTRKRNKRTRREVRPEQDWINLPDATPAIIDKGYFEQVQSRLQAHAANSTRARKYEYLLGGHVFCGVCGRRFYAVPAKGVRYYRCSGQSRVISPVPCANHGRKAGPLEETVWAQVEAVLYDPEVVLAELHRRKREPNTLDATASEVTLNDAQLQKLVGQEKRLLRLYRYGEYDQELLGTEMAEVARERKALGMERERLVQRMRDAEAFDRQLDDVKVYCQRIRENLGDLSFEDKRRALSALQIRVKVGADSVQVEGTIPLERGCNVSPPSLTWASSTRIAACVASR